VQKIIFDIFLKRLCDHTDIRSQSDLANALNISRSAITQAKKNDSIPQKWFNELSRKFDLNPRWLEYGAGSTFSNANDTFVQIPKVKARLSAGGGSFETKAEIAEFYSFRADWLNKKGRPKDMVLMDIIGNSMEPELKEGDTVLIDQFQKAVLAGAIFAVGLADTIVVKRLERRPEELILLSENKNYPPTCFRGEEMNGVRIIGKVIWSCREFF